MNLETKITIYKFTPQVFTLTLIVRRTVAVHETGARNLPADKPGETAGSGGKLFLFPFPARRAAVAPDTYLEYNTDFKHDFSF